MHDLNDGQLIAAYGQTPPFFAYRAALESFAAVLPHLPHKRCHTHSPAMQTRLDPATGSFQAKRQRFSGRDYNNPFGHFLNSDTH